MNPLLLTNNEGETETLRLDLVQQAGNEARELFLRAYDDFFRGIEEQINFDPGYQLQDGECFRIDNFDIGEDIILACRQPITATRVEADELEDLDVKAIVGYNFSQNRRQILFQNFDSRRVLIPGKRFAVLAPADSNTFEYLNRPVVLLDAQLGAVWENGTLFFKKFHLAKQIFDLSAYFTEATNEQIEGFANHNLMSCADTAAFTAACNTTWSRKKVALILRGGALNDMTADLLRGAAQIVDYDIPMDGDRVLLPTARAPLKELLQFLDEDIYRGPISQRRLLSSGKREL